MKKILLAAIFGIVSLTTIKATTQDFNPTGKGFYICGQAGGGVLFLSGEGKIYEINSQTGVLNQSAGNGSVSQALPSLQLNWGYSHRFQSDLTLGGEFTVISPAVRLGYMINDRHHIAVGAHYALVARMILGYIVEEIKKDLPDDKRDLFSLDLDGLSGIGISVNYEYFASSKNFFRVQLRTDYYGAEGKVGGLDKISKGSKLLPFALDGKGTAWDVTLGVGFGSQW